MKTSTFAAIAAMAFLPVSLAQSSSVDPGPSPTASVGCEPHGDHWHCEGPKDTASAAEPTSTDEEHDHDHDHDHDEEAEEAGPSPTESVGCEPHGDHWHCEGPKDTGSVTVSSSEPTSTDEEHDHDHDHGDEEEAGPSPTESVGCEPHGDHWHCDGPRETVNAPASTTPSAEDPEETGAAAAMMAPLAGVLAVAAFVL